jgi:hypothetical protein
METQWPATPLPRGVSESSRLTAREVSRTKEQTAAQLDELMSEMCRKRTIAESPLWVKSRLQPLFRPGMPST